MNLAFASAGDRREPAVHLVVPDAGRTGLSEFPVSAGAAAAAAAGVGLNKRKRRPAGTPDPDAEVVALSPKTLMESDRYVCEICNQGFQRDQNLQMHRRRHKVPWKLLKRPNLATTKRVYICPERSCLHHDPAHALGDLVGIKKHYRRKHCTEKQWKCDKCSKGYAVQSDYKAHLKTCGTRGHCCDCGRVFSRVESFIEHQDTCSAVKRKSSMIMQSGGDSETVRLIISPTPVTDKSRASNESPSQSSDTTQAMSFTQSGMSDTARRDSVDISTVTNSGATTTTTTTALLEEHARRTQAESQGATPSSAPMPAWLTDLRRNKLELDLQRTGRHGDHIVDVTKGADHRHFHGSRSRVVTRCSSNSAAFPASEVISCDMKRNSLEAGPSLQLSIGPTSAPTSRDLQSPSTYTDIKPSLRTSSVAALARDHHEPLGMTDYHDDDPKLHLARVLEKSSSRPTSTTAPGFKTLAHLLPVRQSGMINKTMSEGAKTDQTVESSAGLVLNHQSTVKSKHENINLSCTEMVSYYNAACGTGGSTSMYRENWVGNVHASDPALGAGARATMRRGINRDHAQLERPATSSVMTTRQSLHLDVAGSASKFVSNELAFRSQKQMAAAARATAVEVIQGTCDQASKQAVDMNKFPAYWSSDLVTRTVTRKRPDEELARQEYCEEAQRELLARAEILKREAREQLQFAAAEKAYANRAREAAKRQVEISEAELEKAKRLRAHAQSELQKAGASFCHSCKSAIDNCTVTRLSRRSAPTSPTADPSLAAAAAASNPAPGNRISWSESTMTGTIWHAHHGSYNNMKNCGKLSEPPSGGDHPVVVHQVSLRRELSDRTPDDFDLNGISC